tara:strand:- start:357 stop:1349 length:993 start_codon:yes stop_codon:yes gene_type:complete
MSEATEKATEEEKFFGVKTDITSAVPDDLKVEIVDDTPEEDRRPKKQETASDDVDDDTLDKEISEYSKRAGDRINKIKYEYHEERRAKEAANRESQEAVNNLQTVMQENQRLQQMVSQGGDALNKQAMNNAQWAKHNAQAQFKKAYDEGDADEMAKAQELLSRATYAEQNAPAYAQSIQNQVAKNASKDAPQQLVKPKLDPEMQVWSGKNPWFMGTDPAHREMTSYAMYLDQSLKAKGVDPATKSKEYYSEIDTAMKGQFPEFFGVQSSNETEIVQEEAPKRQPANVVAPAQRNSGKKPRSIRLTQSQVRIAKKLGITNESYANQLLRES